MTIDERMRYAGTIGLLCECSVHLGHGPDKDELRDCIERAALDWAKESGWSVHRVLHRIEVDPPKQNKTA